MVTVEKLITIIKAKLEEGLKELPNLAVTTQEFTICFNNTLALQNVLSKLTFQQDPKIETKE